MRIAGMFEDDEEKAPETTLDETMEKVHDMPKKKKKSAGKTNTARNTKIRSSSKAKGRSKAKRSKPSSSNEKNNGTVRESPRGAYHVMSVHIPLPMLKKLDAKVATLKKQGKEHASRSGFAIHALSSKL